MKRLVAISNRVGPVRGAARAGGLAVALVDVLRARQGLWCGWSGKTTVFSQEKVQIRRDDELTLATVDLGAAEFDDYYGGFSNRCLWPLFHYRIDLTAFDRRYFEAYLKVNAKFARSFHPLLRPDDLIWIHDYHLIPLAAELREMGVIQPMGFFLHIPFPSRDVMLTLPYQERLMHSMFAYDVVGFQTGRDLECFLEHVVGEFGGRLRGDRITAFGRTITVKALPVGIDTDVFAAFAESGDGARQFDRVRALLRNRELVIGVDRLDYTKGLPDRFKAFALLLENYPAARGQLEYMQIAPPSRSEVPEYASIRSELEGLAGHINGRFAEVDWQPLRYINRAYSRRALAGIYRASRVGLVTPLRDGMNLVAKEYIAAQDPADPGVLVLSRFAGAAAQMQAALVVNPYDTLAVAEAMQTARFMKKEERQNRWETLMTGLRQNDAGWWQRSFLDALEDAAVRRR